MSLSISSSVSSLYVQQSVASSSSQGSSASPSPSGDDTYTPNSQAYNATKSAIHQYDNEVSVNVSSAVTAQTDASISNVMSMYGI